MKRTIFTVACCVAVVLVLWAPVTTQQPQTLVSETNGAVAGTPADAETNTEPFLSRVGARLTLFNGTTWDRWRGDTTSGAWVNVKNTTLAVTQASASVASGAYSSGAFASGAFASGAFASGSYASGAFASGSMAAGACADGCNVTLGAKTDAASTATNGTSTSVVSILKEISAMEQAPASRAVTNAGTFAVQSDIVKNNGVAIASPDANSYAISPVAATATTAAGASACYFTSAASTNANFCKASAGNVYAVHVTNTTTTNYYLRLYNLTAAPTCSSATGFIETIPALGAAANGGVNGRAIPTGQAFSTGIAYCLTGGGSSTDNTNAATGVYVTIDYK